MLYIKKYVQFTLKSNMSREEILVYTKLVTWR